MIATLALALMLAASSAAEVRALADAGNYADAETAARQLLVRAEAEHGARSLAVATALELLAESLAALNPGDTEGVGDRLALAERALTIRKELSGVEDKDLAHAYYVVGLVHNLVGDAAAALQPFEEALRIAEATYGKDAPQTEVYVREVGTALFGVGRYRDALDDFERYRRIAESRHGEVSAKTLPAYYNIALTQRVLGRVEDADRSLRTAEQILDAEDDVNYRDLIWVRNLRGTMLILQGRLAESLDRFAENLVLAREHLGPEAPEVYELQNYLARVRVDLGDYEGARDLLTHTLANELPETVGFMACSMRYNLALAQAALGDVEAARDSFEKFRLEVPSWVPPTHSIWGEFHREYGALLFETGDRDTARVEMDAALEVHRRLGEYTIDYATTLARSGAMALAAGDVEAAEKQLTHAVAIIGEVARDHQRFYAFRESLAQALHASGDDRRAFDAALDAARGSIDFDRATIALLPRRLALARATVPHTARDLVFSLALSPGDDRSARSRAALNLLIRSRGIVTDEMVARERRWADAADPEFSPVIADWHRARTRVANLFTTGPQDDAAHYNDRITRAQEDVERLERTLAKKSREYRTLFLRRDADADALAARIDANDALVAYVRFHRAQPGTAATTPHYAAVVVRGGHGDPTWFDLGPAARIEAQVAAWRAEIGPGNSGAYGRAGAALRVAVWDPLEGALAGATDVLLVPDAALHLVSFAALPRADDRFLIDDARTMRYLTAERDLIPDDGDAERTSSGLLIVGNPAFGADAGAGAENDYRGSDPCPSIRSRHFGPLPGATTEARIVRKLWIDRIGEPVDALDGIRATEGAVKQAARGKRVVHLATHGFFLGEECASGDAVYRSIGGISPRRRSTEDVPRVPNPMLLSGLALAGANRLPSTGDDAEDGVLTAEEVGTLDLRGVELAVLSACRTGTGSLIEGEGLFGLRRAFLLAGAQTVVTNLWDVEDRSARVWIESLYRERFVDGRTFPEAVQAASRQVLEARRRAGLDTNPFYWAGWLAVGAE